MKKYSYMIFDIAIVVVSVAIANLLKFDFNIPNVYYLAMKQFMIISIISTIGLSVIFGNYTNQWKYFGFYEMMKQISITVFVGTIFLIIKLNSEILISGTITLMYCLIYFLTTCAVRAIPRFETYLNVKFGIKQKNNAKVLIIGAGKAGEMIVNQFIDNKQEKFTPVGILDDDVKKHGQRIAGVKIYGSIDKVNEIALKLGVDEILVTIPALDREELQKIFEKVSNTNIPTKIFQSAVDIKKYQQGDKKALKDFSIEDLLFRESIKDLDHKTPELIKNKTILVTGGAGSIGSELCRQVLENYCAHLVICDINENGLFELNEELKEKYYGRYTTCIASVRDKKRLENIFEKYNPQIVFHAAAHKHVPMMELNPFEAVKNNILGTRNTIVTAIENNCEKFVLISTDKAVNPTNIMGATKRICELLIKTYNNKTTEMVAVRFGNVLGSNGSVIPLFKKQIANGGPVTVTHKEMTRYFMTIKEAVSLVLLAVAEANGSELFVLDMGRPIKIYDLAVNLIKISGFIPNDEIKIKITGLRQGEKLYEELNLDSEVVDNTSHEKIFIIKDNGIDKNRVLEKIKILEELVEHQNYEEQLRKELFELINEELLVGSR